MTGQQDTDDGEATMPRRITHLDPILDWLRDQARAHGEVLTDAEWREFQSIPEQGYSHRHWVDTKILDRLARRSQQEAPTGDVLVEGSWFKRDELPVILGNFMRASDAASREAKAQHLRAAAAEAELVELAPLRQREAPTGDAPVITLCGSTKFKAEFMAENQRLTMEGNVVISLGLFGHTDLPDYNWDTDATDLKTSLDRLHFQKIRMADRVHVVDPGGYVGESTRREIAYAESLGKPITYLSGLPVPDKGQEVGR